MVSGKNICGNVFRICNGMQDKNSDLLFFILIFLLLFYDNRPLRILRGKLTGCDCSIDSFFNKAERDPKLLFFILIFLILFY